jgi:hypothetical protein
MNKEVRLHLIESQCELSDIDEFACGYTFFFIRFLDGRTLSIPLDRIRTAERKDVNNTEWLPIQLKRAKFKKSGDDTDIAKIFGGDM